MFSQISSDTVRNLIQNFPVAACLIGRDRVFLAANSEFAQLLGAPDDGVAGRCVVDLFGEEIDARVRSEFATFDAGGLVENHESRMGERILLVAVRPIRETSNGPVTAICVALTDITAQKTLERRLELANEQLSAANRQLAEAARIDAVTGLWNRRALDELLPREIARSRRDRLPLSVLMVDIDYFKKFNDRYGHLAGDIALRDVAQAMEDALHRPGDMIARYGGEEFLVMLPATDADAAQKVARQLRSAVAARAITDETSHLGRLTVSIGVASLNIVPREASVEAVRINLVHSADQALYAVKSEGRDGIRFHVEALPSPLI